MEERIEALRTQLKQVQGTKTRLEHQMDNLVVTDAHYNKKISDFQRRYDEQYDKAETIETQMDEWNSWLLVESDSDMFPRTDRCLKSMDMSLKIIERTGKTSIYSYGD